MKQDKFTQEAKLLRSAWWWDTVHGGKNMKWEEKNIFHTFIIFECFCIPSQKVLFPLETPPTYYYFQRKRFSSEGKVYQGTDKFYAIMQMNRNFLWDKQTQSLSGENAIECNSQVPKVKTFIFSKGKFILTDNFSRQTNCVLRGC